MDMNKSDENFKCFKECLEKLLKNNFISNSNEKKIAEIAKTNGTEGLSPDQQDIFYEHIHAKYFDRKCSKCGETIPWEEMPMLILDEKKICGSCVQNSCKND